MTLWRCRASQHRSPQRRFAHDGSAWSDQVAAEQRQREAHGDPHIQRLSLRYSKCAKARASAIHGGIVNKRLPASRHKSLR